MGVKPILSLKRAAVAAASFALGGCVSVLPEPTAPDALIQIPSALSALDQPLNKDVSVFAPDASRAASGIDIVVADGDALTYLPRVHWADPAPSLLQTALVDALSEAPGQGFAFAAQSAARADYEVRWRIIKLAVAPGSSPAQATARVSLVDARTRRTVDAATVSATSTPASGAAKDRADALADAIRQLARDAARFVTTTVDVQAEAPAVS